MTFVWPLALLALLVVPVLVVAYRGQERRRAAGRARLAGQGFVVPETSQQGRGRHVPAVLLLAALTLLLVSLARPEATVTEPHREGTVILAFDVSTSMGAQDVTPTRLGAAKAAAASFVRRQPAGIRLGVVAFGDSAVVAQQPTDDRTMVLAAIDRLSPQGGTSLGQGIVAALGAIAGKPITVPRDDSGSLDGVDVGYYGSAAMVLLSDGENTTPPDPLAAADLASAAGVRVYPVGLGSPEGTVLKVDGFSISTALDEVTLQQIAQRTDGQYRSASDAAALAKVYDSIHLAWTARSEKREVTSWFAAAAAVLLLAGAALSILRSGRVV